MNEVTKSVCVVLGYGDTGPVCCSQTSYYLTAWQQCSSALEYGFKTVSGCATCISYQCIDWSAPPYIHTQTHTYIHTYVHLQSGETLLTLLLGGLLQDVPQYSNAEKGVAIPRRDENVGILCRGLLRKRSQESRAVLQNENERSQERHRHAGQVYCTA